MQYVSRWFHLEPEDAPEWRCLSIAAGQRGLHRSAMMLRAEGDRWGVVLVAPTGEPLPSDDTAFLDFTAGLADGELRDALVPRNRCPPIHHYGPTSNRIMHYDRLRTWPAGLVALGDAVCALDPYFGLGMTATARGALAPSDVPGPSQRRADTWRGVPEGTGVAEYADHGNWPPAAHSDRTASLHCDATHLRRLYEAAPSRPGGRACPLLAVHHLLRPAETRGGGSGMRVAVLGGGTAGFIAAAHLTRSLPQAELVHVFELAAFRPSASARVRRPVSELVRGGHGTRFPDTWPTGAARP